MFYLQHTNKRTAVSFSLPSSFSNQTSLLSTKSQIAPHKLQSIPTKAAALQSAH